MGTEMVVGPVEVGADQSSKRRRARRRFHERAGLVEDVFALGPIFSEIRTQIQVAGGVGIIAEIAHR